MENFLADVMLNLVPYKSLLEDIEDNKKVISVNGIIEEAIGHFIYSVNFHAKNKNILLITFSESRAKNIYEDLKNLKGKNVYYFDKKEDVFYNTIARSKDSANNQIKSMNALLDNNSSVVITTFEAMLQKVSSPEIFYENTFKIKLGEIYDRDEIIKNLINSGYENVESVEGRGEFSIRGSIIDLFSPNSEYPYRIEFFGDEIDTIRTFEITTQRSIESINKAEISPAREILIENIRDDIAKKIEEELSKSKIKDEEIKDRRDNKYYEIISRLKDGLSLDNLDMLVPFIDENNLSSIASYLDEDDLIFIDEPRRLEDKSKEFNNSFIDRYTSLLEQGETLKPHESIYYTYEDIRNILEKNTKITFSNILRYNKFYKPDSILSFSMKSQTTFNGKIDIFSDEIRSLQYRGYKTVILTGDKKREESVSNLLDNIEIKYKKTDEKSDLKSGEVILDTRSTRNGFEYSDIKFMVLNYREIYGEARTKKEKKKKSKDTVDFSQMEIGDFIVHENNGVGTYQGTKTMEVFGSKKDYIEISYAGEDKLYVPADQLGLLHKYTGTGTSKPKLNKLNSTEWQKTREKTKKAIDDMADELIKLYAIRQSKEGYKFSEDTIWQKEFEDRFPYVETEGQLRSAEEVKEDMEKIVPMDRLLMADVGYGKTEVALRAAFKAIMDSKQVAFLVPTTILAKQHYITALERFRGFPINIELFSRFKTRSEINEGLKGLKNGSVDLAIGTHRLLSKDVEFKDLGLLIIDEEQRFGVRDKETLKMIKENVDTLTLTATPIPRTLQMSMMGIRNMSSIEEPPDERFPVQTYVSEFNPVMIREAILRELDRDGQVFFLHNRVSDIETTAYQLSQLVPEASILIAHGQMSERELENRIVEFMDGEYDILVCTTIIETGVDMPNVNTIIVDDADYFGLSQLYQLRGRVGRSNKLGYAYFTYQKDKILTEVAEKRLMAIKQFIDFGSGRKIATRDLEIRGAGNILSSRQHGHINSIGYDLYIDLLQDSIKSKKGEEVKEVNNTTIDLAIDASIPKNYIRDDNTRLEFYKKISIIESEEDYHDLIDEMIDRFGDMPEETSNLIDIAEIKFIANDKKIESITGSISNIRFRFMKEFDFKRINVENLVKKYGNRLKFNSKGENYLDYKPQKYIIEEIKDILKEIE